MKALITGITGQDGSFLAELLLSKGYEVHGIVRRVAAENQLERNSRIEHLLDKVHLHGASLENYGSIFRVVEAVKPDEVYSLAAQSYVGYSFDDELSTMQINLTGTHYLLNAVKEIVPHSKFYFAGSSEQFGKVHETPQKETTPFHPRSSYGVSKVAGYYLTQNYREAYGMFACNGILFNHESERRGFEFVTRKISSFVAKVFVSDRRYPPKLHLGNIDAKRDWGYAKDYVKAMWLMLQQPSPDDYVIATGETHSVREFLELAFKAINKDYHDYVVIDPALYRPSDVELLLGDPTKAKEKLKWSPVISFEQLVSLMVEHDIERVTYGM